MVVLPALGNAEIDRLFRALADATRRDIVRRTLIAEATVSELADHYAMSWAAVQKHVAVLEGAELVTKHVRGRERIVSGNPAQLRRAQALLDSYEQLWRGARRPPGRPPRRRRLKGPAMPITSVTKDPENLTMTVVADFPVPLRRLWDAYVDPRQLEKFWGPPQFPATFTRHDAFPGGVSTYAMTGPDGSRHGGYWEWVEVKEPEGDVASFEVRDGFALLDETPNTDMPSMFMSFWFESTSDGSRVTTTTHFPSAEALAQLLGMGMEEGLCSAMAQMDDVLADLQSFAAGRGTTLDVLSETQIRISRVIRGPVADVWRAHAEPELMRQWLLGPDGWFMTKCDWTMTVGETYRLGWAREDGTDGFGFGGEFREVQAPHRLVTTERMFGDDGPETVQVITLTPLDEGTLLTQVHTYPDREAREQALDSGMVEGIESTYARLESLLA